MVMHTFNYNIWEAEAGRSIIQGQHGLHNEFPATKSSIVRPCLKTRTTNGFCLVTSLITGPKAQSS